MWVPFSAFRAIQCAMGKRLLINYAFIMTFRIDMEYECVQVSFELVIRVILLFLFVDDVYFYSVSSTNSF